MFSKKDITRNEFMLDGKYRYQGYDWWWHNFTATNDRTGEEVAFFIEYFLCNPALGGDEAILGQNPLNKELDLKPSYLMIKAGCWGKHKKQLHRFIPWNEVIVDAKAPFAVIAKNCIVTEKLLRGSVNVDMIDSAEHPEYMCDSGHMEWDISVNNIIPYNVGYGASKFFRKIKAFDMYWHAEGMKTEYEGRVTIDGEDYTVRPKTSYGYADKNWGQDFTSPWLWLSSNCMYSKRTGAKLNNSVFDIGGGCPVIFGVPLTEKLLGGFYYEGEEFEYNFSKFWTLPRTKFDFREDDKYVYWRVWQENRTSLMKVSVRCKKEDMLFVNYEAPDGSKRHNRLWNGGTGEGRVRLYRKTFLGRSLIDDIRISHVGCEYGEYTK